VKYFTARYVLVDSRFLEGQCVAIADDGRIAAVGPPPDDVEVEDLGEVAVMPGLVNAHSHAFQRAIRGRTEWADPDRSDDFWSWRERMYAAATSFDPEDVYRASRWAFLEMALSGITTVGEFHYLHHQPDGTPYDDANEVAHHVIAAARDVGIRIALLRVAYRRGGVDRTVEPEQRRFVDPSDEHLLVRCEALRARYSGNDDVVVGLAPHSIRAVSAQTMTAVTDAARDWDAPLHIHACEQHREIEESIAEYDRRPVEVFNDLGMLDERLTIVHGTHVSELELDLLTDGGSTVCACPTTERNLGDGFLPARDLVKRGVPIALGSDSHTNIDLWEDARCVEYHERLRTERRNVLATATLESEHALPHRAHTAEVLWPMLSEHGARALRMDVGTLEAGKFADFITLDLTHPTLVGGDADSLLTDACLSMTPGAVRDVFVGGEAIVHRRDHPHYADAMQGFRTLTQRLAASS
jgi:formimidoylglutamate deiminase